MVKYLGLEKVSVCFTAHKYSTIYNKGRGGNLV